MAERVDIALIDDLDGTEPNHLWEWAFGTLPKVIRLSVADHTLTSALDGVVYEVDLNQSHAAQLRAILEQYLSRARPASKASAAPAAGKTARAWRDRRR